MWYDGRGNAVKSAAPDGLVSKAEYDGAGRQTKTYRTNGGGDGGYGDADDVLGDVVPEQSETTYDGDGNALLVVTRQRFHDATGTGGLGTPTAGVGARVSSAGCYYDLASRTTAAADVGTNGGSAWTRPPAAPARSDTALVSGFEYAADAVQTVRLTGSPTGGTFTLTAGGQTTAGIAYNATPAAVDAALEALSSVGAGNVAVAAAAGGGWEVRFTGALAGRHRAALAGGGSGLTGGTSPGVAVGTVSAGGDAGRVAAATDPRGLVARTYAGALGRSGGSRTSRAGWCRTRTTRPPTSPTTGRPVPRRPPHGPDGVQLDDWGEAALEPDELLRRARVGVRVSRRDHGRETGRTFRGVGRDFGVIGFGCHLRRCRLVVHGGSMPAAGGEGRPRRSGVIRIPPQFRGPSR